MTKQITEQEFIEQYGEEAYTLLMSHCYNCASKSDEFKNDKPFFRSLFAWDLKCSDPWKTIACECTAIKTELNERLRYYDFGIINMWFSDEEMPDEILDKYNEIKQSEVII